MPKRKKPTAKDLPGSGLVRKTGDTVAKRNRKQRSRLDEISASISSSLASKRSAQTTDSNN